MQLEQHRTQIRQDIQEVKQSLGPVLNIASFMSKATTPDPRRNSLVKTGANLAIDWATRRLIPGRSSLLGTIGGFFAKNLASHFLNRSENPAA
jgi:hypothetical protein